VVSIDQDVAAPGQGGEFIDITAGEPFAVMAGGDINLQPRLYLFGGNEQRGCGCGVPELAV